MSNQQGEKEKQSQQDSQGKESADMEPVVNKFGNKFIQLNKAAALLAANFSLQVITKQIHNLFMIILRPVTIFLKSFKRYGKPDANEMVKIFKEMADHINSDEFQGAYEKILKLVIDDIIRPGVAIGGKFSVETTDTIVHLMMENSRKILGAPAKAVTQAAAGAVSAIPGVGAVTGVLKILTAVTKFVEMIITILKMPFCALIGIASTTAKLGSKFGALTKPATKVLGQAKPAIEFLTEKSGKFATAMTDAQKVPTAVPVAPMAGGARQKFKPDVTLYLFDNSQKTQRTRRKRRKRKRKSRRRK